jgi:hypothetical protein
MFYCEECRKKKGWPESMMRSFGPCEVCRQTRECYDVSSKHLPWPEMSVAECDEINAVLERHGIDLVKFWGR